MSVVIRDIVTLDLTETNEELIKEIKSISDIVVFVIGEKQRKLLNNTAIKDIVTMFTVPENCKLFMANGNTIFNKAFSDSITDKIYMTINGNLTIDKNIDIDKLNEFVVGGMANGNILCPSNVYGFLNSKLTINGNVTCYNADNIFINDSVTVTEKWLQNLSDDSCITINGQLTIDVEFANENLFSMKLKSLEVLGEIETPEKYEKPLLNILSNSPRILIIPDNYIICKTNVLDARSIREYKGHGIFSKGNLIFENQVSLNDITGIKTNGYIIAPKSLEEQLDKLCDLSTKIYYYNEKLNIINGEYKLTKSELEINDAPESYFINGILEIKSDISVSDIKEKIDAFFINGMIKCSEEQYGIINKKTMFNNGQIAYDEKNQPEEKAENQEEIETKTPEQVEGIVYEDLVYLKL